MVASQMHANWAGSPNATLACDMRGLTTSQFACILGAMRGGYRSVMKSFRFAVLGLWAFSLWAQTDRSTITGTITDPAGAVLPAVPIEAKNTHNCALYQAITSTTG